jgi:hypothetical protein
MSFASLPLASQSSAAVSMFSDIFIIQYSVLLILLFNQERSSNKLA